MHKMYGFHWTSTFRKLIIEIVQTLSIETILLGNLRRILFCNLEKFQNIWAILTKVISNIRLNSLVYFHQNLLEVKTKYGVQSWTCSFLSTLHVPHVLRAKLEIWTAWFVRQQMEASEMHSTTVVSTFFSVYIFSSTRITCGTWNMDRKECRLHCHWMHFAWYHLLTDFLWTEPQTLQHVWCNSKQRVKISFRMQLLRQLHVTARELTFSLGYRLLKCVKIKSM